MVLLQTKFLVEVMQWRDKELSCLPTVLYGLLRRSSGLS